MVGERQQEMDFDEAGENGEENHEGSEGVANNEDFLFGNEEEGKEGATMRDAVIFVVDCGVSMLAQNPHNEGNRSNVEAVLRAACSFLKTKIVTSDSDRVALVLYSCRQAQNALDLPRIAIFRKLDFPDALTIKELGKLAESRSAFETTFGGGDEACLCDVLSVCHNLLQSIEKLNCSKRIFLFSDNDNPNAENKHNQQRAIQRAHDLYEQNVDIELFPMQRPTGNQQFNIQLFYADLISVDNEQLTTLTSQEATATRFEDLNKRIRQKEYHKRVLGKCIFHLSPKMDIAVKVFNLLQEVKKPVPKNLDAKSNKPLKTITRWICEETGAVLYPSQIGTYFPYGGEKVILTKDEMKTIKKFDDPGIKLMGFKPRSALKDYMNIRSAYFLYPDEATISGSGQVMDALIREMAAADRIAIARIIPKDASVVRFCALLPQEETIDPEDNFQRPGGFHLIFLPYSDDIRSPQTVVKPRAEDARLTEDQRQAAHALVKNMSIDFDSRQFENPAIQKFYSAIQALALGEEKPEPIKDTMQPDYAGMQKFAPVLDNYKAVTFGADYDCNDPASGKGKGKGKGRGKGAGAGTGAGQARGKRGAPDTTDGPKCKKAKSEENSETEHTAPECPKGRKPKKERDPDAEPPLLIDDAELAKRLQDGTIKSLSVPRIKDLLRDRKLKIGKGNKDTLIDQLRNYLAP